MSFTLVLNSQNVFGTGNNTYKYNFIQGMFNIPPDSEVMVANVQIPIHFIISLLPTITIHFSSAGLLVHQPILHQQ